MTQGQREGKVKLHTEGSSRLSSYRHRIYLIILLKIWWGIHNNFAFHDHSLPFLPGRGEEKNPWDIGHFRVACGTGSGLTEDQWSWALCIVDKVWC